ncbi:Aldehyde dehydrogenase 22A1 [Capsicum chinense]|nr:Aldehyde dehydrogenase 22A1 [Capsicum chinense]
MKVVYLTPYGNCAQAFGPILPITKFISDVEAVQIANDSSYGLGCAVFSGSQRRARQIASQLHCGVAAAVSDCIKLHVSVPSIGGVRQWIWKICWY